MEDNRLVLDYSQNVVKDIHFVVEDIFLLGFIAGKPLWGECDPCGGYGPDPLSLWTIIFSTFLGLLNIRSEGLVDSFRLLGSFSGVPYGIDGWGNSGWP